MAKLGLRSGPSCPVWKTGTAWPYELLVATPDPHWNHYRSPGNGCCDICKQALRYFAYDCLLDGPDGWAILCNTCFEKMECKLGPKLGQRFYRPSGDGWFAIPPGPVDHAKWDKLADASKIAPTMLSVVL